MLIAHLYDTIFVSNAKKRIQNNVICVVLFVKLDLDFYCCEAVTNHFHVELSLSLHLKHGKMCFYHTTPAEKRRLNYGLIEVKCWLVSACLEGCVQCTPLMLFNQIIIEAQAPATRTSKLFGSCDKLTRKHSSARIHIKITFVTFKPPRALQRKITIIFTNEK